MSKQDKNNPVVAAARATRLPSPPPPPALEALPSLPNPSPSGHVDGRPDAKTDPNHLKTVPGGATPRLTITCDSSQLACSSGGRVPGGTRLHLKYLGGIVAGELEGRVLSGTDWILIREDGVAEFDARFTLGKSANDVSMTVDEVAQERDKVGKKDVTDDFLVNARMTGLVDLRPHLGNSASLYSNPDGFRATGSVSVTLPVRFEATGKEVSWSKPRLRQLAQNISKYGFLVSNQFLAVGTVNIDRGVVTGLRLEIRKLGPET